MWESAYLGRVKEFPELAKWLDPPRTRRLSPEEAQERKAAFRDAVEASNKVPVRRPKD